MKVLVVTTTDSMIWNFLIPHISYLKSRGHEVDCACSKTGFYYDELVKNGLNVHEIPFERSPYKLKNFNCYLSLKKIINEYNYDVLFCHEPVGGAISRLAGKQTKVIYMAHGFHFYKGGKFFKNVLYKNIESILAHYTDVIITINEEDYNAACLFKTKKDGFVALINGIGVDLNKYNIKNDIKRSNYKLDADTFVVISTGELIPRKNMISAIRAFNKANLQNSILMICGEGEQMDELKKYVSDKKIDNIYFLGFRKDVASLLKISDVFLFTSKQEGLCIAGIEALACGLPLVTSNCRGVREYSINGITGYCCDYADIDGLARGLKQIYENNDKRVFFKNNCIEKVKQYDINSVISELNVIYERVGL